MAGLLLLYDSFTFLSLFSLGLYHLISATRSFLKPTHPYSALPYHPLPTQRLHHLPLVLTLTSLLLSLLFHFSLHTLPSLRTAVALSLFLLLLLTCSFLPSELVFLLSSLSFSLLSFPPTAPYQDVGDLSVKTDSLSATISLSSAAFALALSLSPKLFLADVALSASLLLKSLWSLQTLLTLYVDAFIPDGCHRLLDLPRPSTRCDLDESRARAAELLALALALHSLFVAAIVVAVYAAVARVSGGGLGRRSNGGSYDALPTSSSCGALADVDHLQMKAIGKSSAQE